MANVEFGGKKSLGVGIGSHPLLFSIAGDIFPANLSRPILTPDRKTVNVLFIHRVNRTEYFDLFIPDEISGKPDRGFHGHQSDELQHMILHNISYHPGLFIKGSPVLHPQILSHRNLNVINITPVPELFEDAVGKTEKDDILDRFFPQVVIDPVYLMFLKCPPQNLIQFQGG